MRLLAPAYLGFEEVAHRYRGRGVGPVAAVTAFDSEVEVIELANHSDYGLFPDRLTILATGWVRDAGYLGYCRVLWPLKHISSEIRNAISRTCSSTCGTAGLWGRSRRSM